MTIWDHFCFTELFNPILKYPKRKKQKKNKIIDEFFTSLHHFSQNKQFSFKAYLITILVYKQNWSISNLEIKKKIFKFEISIQTSVFIFLVLHT